MRERITSADSGVRVVSRRGITGGFDARRTCRAFTLVELLVVMAVIAILATIGLPALKGFGKGNREASAERQLLDDLAFARLKAISGRTTVYVVFVPPGILGHLPQLVEPRERRQLTNLVTAQYAGYALFAKRSVGSQPGQSNPRYLSDWKRLPEGMLFPPYKFDASPAAVNAFNPYLRSMTIANFPFPSVTSSERLLPYIAFNASGQLVSGQDELIPLAEGSVFFPKDASGNHLAPDIVINPPNNHTNRFIRINWLTGRAGVDEVTRPRFR